MRGNASIKLLLCLLLLACAALPAWGADDGDLQALGLVVGEEEPLLSTGRFPRPSSKIAENVTVITADEISRLNAHTLADVLQTVPGIQLDQVRTPGSWNFFSVHGALSRHIQVLIDGIPQTDLIENAADVGMIPVQQIERVEIVKGAASAAWGQALGGVVNVVTKMPEGDRAFGGLAAASAGERFTTDARGEVSGTVRRFGYYLNGGNLHSDGLLPGNRVNFNNAFGKFVYDLPRKGTLALGMAYRDSHRGLLASTAFDRQDSAERRRLESFLDLTYPLAERLSLELQGWLSRLDTELSARNLSDSLLLLHPVGRETRRAASARLNWGESSNNLVTGVEYEHDSVRQDETIIQAPLAQRTVDRWGVFANGALSYGPLTLLPGIRFDHTGFNSDYPSYTLGATCRLSDKTVLRGYGATGYSLPSAVTGNGIQKIWTVQTGIESEEIPYLWLKGTLFYNKEWRVEVPDFVNNLILLKSQIRQGFEIEGRTAPLCGLSLAGGYTFTDARDRETNTRLKSVPVHGAKLALNYDNAPLGLRGVITGNYVWWNSPAEFSGRYSAVIWDLHLNQRLFPRHESAPELFLSVHNLFSGSQYPDSIFSNTRRWMEGGVRFRF